MVDWSVVEAGIVVMDARTRARRKASEERGRAMPSTTSTLQDRRTLQEILDRLGCPTSPKPSSTAAKWSIGLAEEHGSAVTATQIARTIRIRTVVKQFGQGAPTLKQRANKRIAERFAAEIERRGGETGIPTDSGMIPLAVRDRDARRDLTLLGASGWRFYSKRESHFAELAYLCGSDDSGLWAIRVPGTLRTVNEAMRWSTPVVAARREHLRQGDVYAVRTTAAHDGTGVEDLPAHHVWDPQARTLTHVSDGRRHETLTIPWPVRFVRQRQLGMGRGAGRGCGD